MWKAVVLVLFVRLALNGTSGDMVTITTENFVTVLSQHQFVFIMFGADWCPFSRQLQPIFSQAAVSFRDIHPSFDVIWGYVDCTIEQSLCQLHFINKYPTMKIFIRGDMTNREYRARRAVDDLVAYVAAQYTGSIREFNDDNDLITNMNTSVHNVVAYIKRSDDVYKNLYSIAQLLRDFCTFWIPNEKMAENLLKFSLYYKAPGMFNQLDFVGNLHNYTLLKQWITDKCIPLVRELTFENAEDLTEEGLPFLIYFRDPRKKEHDRLFTEAVVRDLYEQRMKINPLLADGFKFAHPLQHIGKTTNDLPLIAIDSFTHMFVFPNISRLSETGALKQFVEDLYSDELHRRFHGGDGDKQQMSNNSKQEQETENKEEVDTEKTENSNSVSDKEKIVQLESVFKLLKPSEKRYSLLRKTEL